jgi:1-deoxypentalenic acid 11beta-hydroxylase
MNQQQVSLGRFQEANEYLGDKERLDALFAEEGYLFFRGVLKAEEVQAAKLDLIRALQKQGVVKAGATEALWTGAGIENIDDSELYGTASYQKVLESKHTLQFMEQIFGEPVFMFKSTTLRYALPNDPARVSPPHQDFFFVRFSQTFRTLWVPLMDIDEQVGGLVLGARTHKRGLLDHVEQEGVYSYVFKGRKQRGIPLESVSQLGVTTNYHAGDLLIFHHLMIHWALPNRSDRLRLSFDGRCQPATAARTWQAERSILEARQFRETAKRIAMEEGADEELFEALIIELMRQGLEPERGIIKALIPRLSQTAASTGNRASEASSKN